MTQLRYTTLTLLLSFSMHLVSMDAPLHTALPKQNPLILKIDKIREILLVKQNRDINQYTLDFSVVMHKHPNCIHAPDNDGVLPIKHAADAGLTGIVKLLIFHEKSPESKKESIDIALPCLLRYMYPELEDAEFDKYCQLQKKDDIHKCIKFLVGQKHQKADVENVSQILKKYLEDKLPHTQLSTPTMACVCPHRDQLLRDVPLVAQDILKSSKLSFPTRTILLP